jgi:hypothetical protein
VGLPGAEGILPPEEIEFLVETARRHGSFVSYRSGDGEEVPYETNTTWYSALNRRPRPRDRRQARRQPRSARPRDPPPQPGRPAVEAPAPDRRPPPSLARAGCVTGLPPPWQPARAAPLSRRLFAGADVALGGRAGRLPHQRQRSGAGGRRLDRRAGGPGGALVGPPRRPRLARVGWSAASGAGPLRVRLAHPGRGARAPDRRRGGVRGVVTRDGPSTGRLPKAHEAVAGRVVVVPGGWA